LRLGEGENGKLPLANTAVTWDELPGKAIRAWYPEENVWGARENPLNPSRVKRENHHC